MAPFMKLVAHVMPSFEPVSLRCISLGLGAFVLGIALRWVPGNPWQLQSIPHSVYAARGALLLGLDVVAMALLTAGVLGTRHTIAVPVCAFWSTAGALFECSQHPAIVGRALAALADLPSDSVVANAISLYLLNGRFSLAELIAALAGGVVAFLCICERRVR